MPCRTDCHQKSPLLLPGMCTFRTKISGKRQKKLGIIACVITKEMNKIGHSPPATASSRPALPPPRHEALGPCAQRERWIPHPSPTHACWRWKLWHLSAQPGFASTSTEEQGIDCETTLLRSSAPRRTGLSNLARKQIGVLVVNSQTCGYSGLHPVVLRPVSE